MHLNTGKTNEELRQTYKPSDVRVLFIGESPPANGTFLYLANSNLWRYTLEAFRNVYGTDCQGNNSFCEFFMSKGCYLEDLCLDPINRLGDVERRRTCEAAVDSLAERIFVLSPEAVVCVKASIVHQVESAMAKVQLQAVPMHMLPFPSCGHQQEYSRGLARLIRTLQVDGAII